MSPGGRTEEKLMNCQPYFLLGLWYNLSMKWVYGILILGLGLICLHAHPPVKKAEPLQIQSPITIDGRLSEEVWSQGNIIQDWMQFEPQVGNPPSFRTKTIILYDRTQIYFGIRCFDPEPEKIVQRLTKRDSELESDDAFGIGLDTFNDQRTAYYFFTNPLGTQLDGRISDNGRTSDTTWDGKWYSAAQITQNGWTAEVAIPLEILKYVPGKEKTWGLGLVRTIPRKMEIDSWAWPIEDIGKVSQWGKLENLNLEKAKKQIQVIPHVITRLQQHQPATVSAGLDARYAITQDISSNLTVNPDFATVEADQEQINLSRFELQLAEKRNFFLEGSEIYKQRIRLFYSRRISDIYGGVKLYGKKGGYEFSALTTQSKPDDLEDIKSANFSVFRVRKDIFKSSTIGFLGANRVSEGKNSGNVGLDLVHFFSDKVNLTGQIAMSYGEYKTENLAFFLRPSYDSSTFHIHLRYTQLGERFADNGNSVGFIRDDDRHELDSAIEKTWWIKKHGIDRFAYDSNYNIYWSKKGTLRSWQIDQEFNLDLSNKLAFEIEYTREYKLYEKEFHNHRTEFEIGYNTREWQSVRLSYEFGRNFDLDFKLYGIDFNYMLLKTLSLEYGLNRLYLTPDPDKENTWIHVIRLTNYFTKDLYCKLFYQTHTAISKYNIQALFVYRFQPPFGTIQLAYQKGSSPFGQSTSQGHTLFLKFSYVL